MLTCRSWPVERAFAFAPVEVCQMPTGKHCPHNAIAIDVEPARRESVNRGIWIVPWQFIYFCKSSCRRIRSWVQPDNGARKTQHSSPDRSIRWADGHAVESSIDPLVFGRINGLIWLHILIPLSVPVGIEDERRPTLRLLFIVGFVKHLRVQPADRSSATTAARP